MSSFKKWLTLGLWLLVALAIVVAYARGAGIVTDFRRLTDDPTKIGSTLVIDAKTVIILDGKTVTLKEFNKEPREITELKVTGRHVDLLRGVTKPAVPPFMPLAAD